MNDQKTENDDLLTEFDHELQVPFDYAYKGETTKANFITLKAPSVKTPHRADLKQCFFRALGGGDTHTDNPQPPVDTEAKQELPTGSEVIQLIAMSKDVKLSAFLEFGKTLLSSGVALVDGETKLTKPLIDMMNPDELEEMLGGYVSNFILAFAFKKLNANS